MSIKRYAIIDGAAEPELLPMLEEYDPPASCLYLDPIQPELAALAPYLTQVNDEVHAWLKSRKSYWGFYFTSYASFKTIRQHWRKYLQVLLPDQDKPVFFRFYDPRNIWLVCDCLNEWDLHHFLVPIVSLSTDVDGMFIEKKFETLRDEFPAGLTMSRRKILKLTQAQLDQLNLAFEDKYIKKLAELMTQWKADFPLEDFLDTDALNPEVFAASLYFYLKAQGIDSEFHVEKIAKIFIDQRLFSLDQLPAEMAAQLEDLSTPGWFRANQLIHAA